jgi:glycosyltransferase involved in cell wall biosynthesis
MSKIGISIIIPCYNAGKFLAEAVESILAQPFRYPFEVIIVDDGSTDIQTQLVLEELQHTGNIKVIRLSENRGVQFARNTGLRLASFDFIFPLDADDCLNSDWKVLEKGTYPDKAIDILNSCQDVAFVHTMTLMFGNYNGLTISTYPVTESLVLEKHHVSIDIIYRREDAINAGLYNESITKWQDWSFAVGLLNSRYLSGMKNNIQYLQIPHLLYRIHSEGQRISSSPVNEKEMIHKTFLCYPEIFRKYYDKLSDEDIVNIVLSKKPDKLKDLMYVASNDIKIALELVSHRGFSLVSNNEPKNIP